MARVGAPVSTRGRLSCFKDLLCIGVRPILVY